MDQNKQVSIKWTWLTVSCISLLTGVVYLHQADLQGAPQFSQVQQP
ncbi:MAG: hypothetical protein AAGF01_24630 [Cyanobacteria bacterium P01_G01_bin.38]